MPTINNKFWFYLMFQPWREFFSSLEWTNTGSWIRELGPTQIAPHAILKLVALLPSLKACQSAFDEKGLVQNAWGYFSTWRNVLTKHSHALAFRMRNSLSSESKAAHQNAFFFKKVNRDNLVLMLGLINIIFSFCACASNKKNPSRLRLKISVFLIVLMKIFGTTSTTENFCGWILYFVQGMTWIFYYRK